MKEKVKMESQELCHSVTKQESIHMLQLNLAHDTVETVLILHLGFKSICFISKLTSIFQVLPNYDLPNTNWGNAGYKLEYLFNCEMGYLFPLPARCPY